jgi:hypothetical protein
MVLVLVFLRVQFSQKLSLLSSTNLLSYLYGFTTKIWAMPVYEKIPLLYSILSDILPVTGLKGPAIAVHAILPPGFQFVCFLGWP